MRLNTLLWTILVLFCAGCGGGAVVFAPTPAPPDLSPMRYQHSGGAFTIDVPRSWSVYEQNTTNLASASFSPPNMNAYLLTISMINLNETLDVTTLVNQYQQAIRPDIGRYIEQDRQAMGDGSWRISGLRQNIGGNFEAVNTFIQLNDNFVSVIDSIILENDPTLFAELQTLVNTLQINPNTALIPTSLETLSAVAQADLEIINVSRWFTNQGVFYITGEVINRTGQTLTNIPISVGLYRQDGTGIAEAVDTVMGHAILPGGFAPFSLRFGQGQPENVTEYILTLGVGEITTDIIYGGEVLTWQDSSSRNEQGHLIIDGVVTNIGEDPIENLLATVTVFDENNTIIATRFDIISAGVLEPEANLSYRFIITELGGIPNDYIINIQGR